jgi:hypothetical protein
MMQCLKRVRVGLLLVAGTVSVAVLVTTLSGPVFGIWGWADLSLVLAVIVLVMILLLATLEADPGPTLRLWHFVEDPQAEFPLMGAPPGRNMPQRIPAQWLWAAAPLALLVGALTLHATTT